MAVAQTLSGSNNQEFFQTIDDAIKKLRELDGVTQKSKQDLNNYAKSFNSLTRELKNFAKTNVKSGSTGGRRNTTSSSAVNRAQKDEENLIKKNAQSAAKAFGDVFSAVAGNSRTLSTYTGVLNKGMKVTGAAVKGEQALTAALGATSVAGAAVVGVLGLIVTALVAMTAAGKKAYERNIQLNNALMQMGASSGEMKNASVDIANKVKDIRNQWTLIGQAASNFFQPVYEFFVDIAAKFTNLISSATGAKNTGLSLTNTGSRVSWYTGMLQSQYAEPETKSIPAINSIAGSARQSGFDLSSAVNLAIGTYDAAYKLSKKFGLEASDIAKQLADAWLAGSDAAKDYGVVVNDTVLTGYMASKGVDIVNVQITDAMKQYYRYQLMMEETNAKSQDAIQSQVKAWTKLGMQIEATKQKLFSFDEVINLQGLDTTIPVVGQPSVGGYDTSVEDTDPIPPITPIPSVIGVEPPPPYDPIPIEDIEPVPIPVEDISPVPIPVEDIEPVPIEVSFPIPIPVVNPVLDWGTVPDLSIDWGTQWEDIKSWATEWATDTVAGWKTVLDELEEWAHDWIAGWEKTGEIIGDWANDWIAGWERSKDFAHDLAIHWAKNSSLVQIVIKIVNKISEFANKIKTFVENFKNGINALSKLDIFGFAKNIMKLPNTALSEATGGNLRIGNTMADAFNALTRGAISKEEFIQAYNSVVEKSSIKRNIDALGEWFSHDAPINLNNIDQVGHEVGMACSTALMASMGASGTASASIGEITGLGKAVGLIGKLGTAAGVVGTGLGVANPVFAKDTNANVNINVKNKQELANLNKDLNTLNNKKTTTKVDADTNNAESGLGKLFKTIQDGVNKKYSAKVDVDTKQAETKHSKLWNYLKSKVNEKNTVKVNADTTQAKNSLNTLSNNVNKAVTPKKMSITLIDRASSRLASIINYLNRIQSKTVTVTTLQRTIGTASTGTRHFASGGIGTHQINNATLFEGNKAEAVIPLESQSGVDYLANALKQAQSDNGGVQGNVTINLSLNGIFDTDDRGKWERLAERLAETIQIQNNRRGGLNYGSSY